MPLINRKNLRKIRKSLQDNETKDVNPEETSLFPECTLPELEVLFYSSGIIGVKEKHARKDIICIKDRKIIGKLSYREFKLLPSKKYLMNNLKLINYKKYSKLCNIYQEYLSDEFIQKYSH